MSEPSSRSLAFVREVERTHPPVAQVLGAEPTALDGPSLLKVILLTRAWLRDAILRTTTAPDTPNWEALAHAADEIARHDLGSVRGVAAWLDAIADGATVAVFLGCRRALVALGREYGRRVAADPAIGAYSAAVDEESDESRRRLVLAVRGKTTTDDEDDTAIQAAVERVFQEGALLSVMERGATYRAWARESPFRQLRPEPVPGWDEHAGEILHQEVTAALRDDLLAIDLSGMRAAAARAVETPRRAERRRRVILDRFPLDLAPEPPASLMPPGGLDELIQRDQAEIGSRALDTLKRKYGRRLWRAYWMTVYEKATDAQAAKRAGLALRTFERRKAAIHKDLEDLARPS